MASFTAVVDVLTNWFLAENAVLVCLSRDHPELSELLCVEMMNRQQDAVGKAAHHQVLTCLPPWMDNLSFAARWEGKPPPTPTTITCMHYKTSVSSQAFCAHATGSYSAAHCYKSDKQRACIFVCSAFTWPGWANELLQQSVFAVAMLTT